MTQGQEERSAPEQNISSDEVVDTVDFIRHGSFTDHLDRAAALRAYNSPECAGEPLTIDKSL